MIWSKLKSYFLTGLIFILPLLFVFYLVRLLLSIIDGVIQYVPLPAIVQSVPFFNVIVFCVVIFSAGWLVTTVLGKLFMKWIDSLINRVPVVRNLFTLIKHAMLSMMSENREHFKYVVLVEYPSANIWSIGFVSRLVKYDVENYVDPENTVSVFLPTSPNPSSGVLIFVSIKKIRILNLSLTEAVNIIMSAGIYCPNSKFTNSHLLSDHEFMTGDRKKEDVKKPIPTEPVFVKMTPTGDQADAVKSGVEADRQNTFRPKIQTGNTTKPAVKKPTTKTAKSATKSATKSARSK